MTAPENESPAERDQRLDLAQAEADRMRRHRGLWTLFGWLAWIAVAAGCFGVYQWMGKPWDLALTTAILAVTMVISLLACGWYDLWEIQCERRIRRRYGVLITYDGRVLEYREEDEV